MSDRESLREIKPNADIKPAAPHLRVLLVEDFVPNVMVLSAYLELFGYAFDIANNGYEAFEMAKRGNYFVALMDVKMHGLNGLEATKRIRDHEHQAGKAPIHIIGMTAHALASDKQRCLEAGMNDYMSKPFNPEELKSKLYSLSQMAS